MHQLDPSMRSVRRLAISVRGVVQGVGFRPFVYNLAKAKGLGGWILNDADMVRLEVQGESNALDEFVALLRNAHPPQAQIDDIEIRDVPCEENSATTFEIRASSSDSAPQPTIPADLAVCDQCLAEIRDPTQRRYRYPFTNCTNCGPRWSIIEQLPYDRPRTSMAQFIMCPQCREEYENPADRRFHAQPIACPKCGPHLELLDCTGNFTAQGEEAITLAAAMVLEGCVLALKGLGGFQLIVDATSADAVARLRERKHRPDRPFALMMATLDETRPYCDVAKEEAEMLVSHRAPIVLLRKKENVNSFHPKPLRAPTKGWSGEGTVPGIVEGVAPGNPCLGVMLPYTPLHYLLMEAVGRPIVCTSGNLSEDPMATDAEDAIARLGSIADIILTHDRPIVRPVDDSIVRLGPCGFQTLRRARGFAPLPIMLQLKEGIADTVGKQRGQSHFRFAKIGTVPTILAVGGHLKNTAALCLGNSVVMTSHVGDLDTLLSVQVFRKSIEDLVNFFAVKPDAVACDLHPDYASTREAESLAAKWGVPIVRVQHHHAHVAAAMAEHNLDGPVLGLAWDGTGYGTDGTIWGGEALRCEGADFSRAAHLRTFPLPGGDQAMREPRRSALGLLHEFLGPEARRFADLWFKADESETLMRMLARGTNCPRTSSMGRLFDAVAALCGLPKEISFEGQAAMALEFMADKNEQSAYPIPLHLDENRILIADWEPMIRIILADLVRRLPVGIISARFHNALADLAVGVAESVKIKNVALTGGCFQNALLTERVYERLQTAGYSVYLHKEVPPGDGGIALGQIYVAALSNL
jgi:hydrogenase maturation protein HypF